jgi:hypothetical protein
MAIAVEAAERLVEGTTASGADWALGLSARAKALTSGCEEAEASYVEAIGSGARRFGPSSHARSCSTASGCAARVDV